MSGRDPGARAGGDGLEPSDRISDREIARIAGGASISFVGRAAGAGLKFSSQLIVALFLGAELFGVYALGVALYLFAELFAGMGLINGVVRYASRFREAGDSARLKGILVRSVQLPLLAGVALAVLLFVSAEPIAVELFDEPALVPVVRIVAVAIPFGASMIVAAFATTAREIAQYLVLVQEVIQPGANVLFLLPLLWLGFGLAGAAAAWVLSFVVGFICALLFLHRVFPVIGDRSVEPRHETAELLGFSLPLALGDASWLLMLWTDVLLLGALRTTGEVGVYRAVSQVALVIPLFLKALNTVFAPMIARHQAAGERDRMRSAFQTATRWSLLLSLPVYLVMVVAGEEVLHLFGAEFVVGATALAVLASGQLLNAGSGGVGYVLMMSGHQFQKMAGDVSFALLNIVLNLLFIPRWGILGAAAATAASIAGLNVVRSVQVYAALRIQAYDTRYLKLAVAAAIGAGGGAAVRALLGDVHFLGTLVATGVVIAGLYLVTLWVEGFEREDELVVDRIRKRLAS